MSHDMACEEKLARLEEQYQHLQKISEYQLQTALNGQLRRLGQAISYELGDALEELAGVPGDLAHLVRTRIKNALRELQTEQRRQR